MALTEPDGSIGSGAKPRRGYKWRVKHILIVLVLVTIAVLVAIPSYVGYRSRALINEAISDVAPLKLRVVEYYVKHERFPLATEAAEFQLAPSDLKRAKSVVWDPAGRSIVVTVAEPQSVSGKRFALYVEKRSDALVWTCRSIDLDAKHMPAYCR